MQPVSFVKLGARVGAVAAAVLAVAILAASCGGSGAKGGSKGPITLVMWDQSTNQPAYKIIDSNFERLHPGIKIVHDLFPVSVFDLKLRTAVAVRQGPDIAAAFPGAFGATNFKQGMTPLDPYIAALPASERSQIRLLNNAPAPDGHVYAVPLGEYAYVLQYNKKLFAKAGLNPNSPPTTYAQLIGDCAKLRGIGVVPIATGWKDGYYLEWYFYVLAEQLLSPAQFAQWQHLQLPMTAPVFHRLFSYILDLQSKGCFDKNAIGMDTFTDPPAQFNSGKAAMILLYQPPDPNLVKKNFGNPNAVDMIRFPRLPDAQWQYPSTDAGPSGGLAIMSWSQHKDAAWQFIRYLESPAAQQVFWNKAAAYPNNSATPVKVPNAYDKAFLHILSTPANHTLFLNFPVNVVQVLYKLAQPLLERTLSVNDFLTQLETARASAVAYWRGH